MATLTLFRALFSALIITIIAGFGIVLSSCAPKLGDSDSALLLEDILAGEDASRLKEKTPSPIRRVVEYIIEDRPSTADLYESPEGSLAGIILIPGVVKQGKDDYRLISLANSLARLRFAVLVPEVTGLRRFHLRTSDVRTLADAFRYLDEQANLSPAIKTGFGGFSYGAGVVLLASLEPDIRNQVDFVMGFGGYYNIANIVTYFTTGYYHDEKSGKLTYHRPHYYLKQVFTISNSDLLNSKTDRDRVRDLIDNDIENVNETLANLAPDARALYELIINEDPERVASLIDRLSPPIKNELQGINPAIRDLSTVKAQVILLHGRGDTMIPHTESISLAKHLPKDKTRLFIIEGYAHTDVKPKPGDLPQLLGAMDLLMQQRTPITRRD